MLKRIFRAISLYTTCFFIGMGWGFVSFLRNTLDSDYRDENGPILKIGNNWKD